MKLRRKDVEFCTLMAMLHAPMLTLTTIAYDYYITRKHIKQYTMFKVI
jgi:hypothetical protein